MTISGISSNNVMPMSATSINTKPNIVEVKPTNMNQQAQNMSPLSSRYTYAMGRDGKRYILQLRIDIASVRAFSTLA
ncbi:hypothetical protein [Brachyspira pilosicoli]|uniref:hypothetical protein n=1 Tax=Brachyspira pilosicoli TaxID=52584 RepID=UPI000C7791CC|nr:hypothetical protein [Brachyspira pilosicoli]PLV55412.1 hypothetical protein BPSP16_11640 [Brachyspira pilosicoli SP16]